MKIKLLFVSIIVLAFFIRFYNVTITPPGLTWDEAALGYNAYSIQQTGRDEYGTFLPLNLKSFGDYKPALYAYLIIPFLSIFGLTELSVRLPSVLAGVGFVILIYFLIKELFNNKSLGLISSLVAAISPLSIQFSRVAYESNLALFANLLATLLFIKGLKKTYFLPLSMMFFGLSLFIYQSSRLFVPLLVIGLMTIYWKQLKIDRWAIGGVVLALFFVATVGFLLLGADQSKRLQTMNFFAYTRAEDSVTQIATEDKTTVQNINFQILHGEWFAYVRGLVERYVVYFSPKMLFVDGDYDPRHRVPDFGILYFTSALFIPLGLLYLLRKNNQGSRLILFWLILAPLPAVLSRDLTNMIRALNFIVPLIILDAAGMYFALSEVLKINRRLFYITILVISGAVLFNFLIFTDQYFVHMPKKYSKAWLYGYKQIVDMIPQNTSSYNKVVMSDTYGQPYIYYLFYKKYPPQQFQKQAVLDQPTADVGTVRKIDNIEFKHVFWPDERLKANSLFIGTVEELPDQDVKPFPEYKILGEVKFLDNQPAFRMVETK